MEPSASVVPRCNGLVIRVDIHEASHQRALKLATQIVRKHLKSGWKVERLDRYSRDFEVTKRGKKKTIAVGAAWNHVYMPTNDREVAEAEPILEMCDLEPDEELLGKQLTTTERVSAKSLGGEKHKSWSVTRTVVVYLAASTLFGSVRWN